MATTPSAAVRIPAMTSGSATGSSTRSSTCRSAHADAARRVDEIVVDLAHADVGVREHGWDSEQHERDERRPSEPVHPSGRGELMPKTVTASTSTA